LTTISRASSHIYLTATSCSSYEPFIQAFLEIKQESITFLESFAQSLSDQLSEIDADNSSQSEIVAATKAAKTETRDAIVAAREELQNLTDRAVEATDELVELQSEWNGIDSEISQTFREISDMKENLKEGISSQSILRNKLSIANQLTNAISHEMSGLDANRTKIEQEGAEKSEQLSELADSIEIIEGDFGRVLTALQNLEIEKENTLSELQAIMTGNVNLEEQIREGQLIIDNSRQNSKEMEAELENLAGHLEPIDLPIEAIEEEIREVQSAIEVLEMELDASFKEQEQMRFAGDEALARWVQREEELDEEIARLRDVRRRPRLGKKDLVGAVRPTPVPSRLFPSTSLLDPSIDNGATSFDRKL
jgi:chromosome segregation ATPase